MALHDGGGWFSASALLESVGDSISRTLLPIVAVSVLGASTAAVGLLNSLGLVAFLLLSLPVGLLADRRGAPVGFMTAGTALRVLVLLGAVAAWLIGVLHGATGLVILIMAAAVLGVADVAFAAGQGLAVPRLVESDHIRATFGRVQSFSQVGHAAGPLILAGLLSVVALPMAWLAVAVMYLGSLFAQRGIRLSRSALPEPIRSSAWAQARAGFTHLRTTPVLWNITLANVLTNAGAMAANTTMPVLAIRDLGLSPTAFAMIGGVGAVSGILGAAVASPLVQRLGLRRTRLLVSAGMAAGVALVASTLGNVLPGPPEAWLGVQAVLAAGGTSIAMVAGSDLPARHSPPEQLGTLMGAQRSMVLGVMPITSMAVGILGSMAGLGPALIVWACLTVLSAVPCLRLP